MKPIPAWVGKPTHICNFQIGGGVWNQAENILRTIAPVMKEYPRRVMIRLGSDVKQEGYRFDLNTWDKNAPSYNWWPDRCSTEGVIKILENANCDLIWSMPTPDRFSPTPYSAEKGSAYPWQTHDYYSAYLQYLIKPTSRHPAWCKKLKENYPFFTDASCTTINKESEEALEGNWGNLRSRRGRHWPYPIQSVLLGIEPYGDAQEGMIQDGARYGDTVMRFRNAIRGRGMTKIPLGLNVPGNMPPTDFSRGWFKPLFDKLGSFKSDFSLIDTQHEYHFGEPDYEANRVFPTLRNVTPVGGAVQSPGFQNYWVPRSAWPPGVDYSRFMWWYDDVRAALKMLGEDPARWKFGCAEHGMSLTSQFVGNNMGAALHWALWLAECMRLKVDFDMMWVLVNQGNAQAQVQVRHGHLTRTPGHYAHKMAMEFIGLEHLANSYVSPTAAENIKDHPGCASPDVEVRTFRNRADGHFHLFVINKHETREAVIPGWEQWVVKSWKQLRANSFTAQNPIGDDDPNGPWHLETIKTVPVAHPNGRSLTIPPISVNHIELAEV